MKISMQGAEILACRLGQQQDALTVYGVYRNEDGSLDMGAMGAQYLDAVQRRKSQNLFNADVGEVWIFGQEHLVAVVGLGCKGKRSMKTLTKALEAVVSKLSHCAEKIALAVEDWCDCEDKTVLRRHLSQVAMNALNPSVSMKKEDKNPVVTKTVCWLIPEGVDEAAVNEELKLGASIAFGKNLTRTLGDLPSNIATPEYLGRIAMELGQGMPSLKVEVMNREHIESMKMFSFMAVAKGSQNHPRFITIRYNGGQEGEAPLALVGKGITFDSGGISLKPAANMWEMKYDMCGAATVFGVMAALAKAQVKKNVIGVIAACENMPGPNSVKPGDVVRSMSGRTIEILNTDAEGRLILADAITWATQQNPSAIIDMATLTGACCIALGAPYTGLFTNDENMAKDLINAGQKVADPLWHMPCGEEYLDLMKSNIADLSNLASKRDGGASSAAAFLKEFTEGLPWIHLDIAATAYVSGNNRHATGRPVSALMQFILESK